MINRFIYLLILINDKTYLYLCKAKWSCFIFLLRSQAESFINWKYVLLQSRVTEQRREESRSFRNCKIFTITVNKVWLRSDSLTSLGAGFTQIKTEQSWVSQLQSILWGAKQGRAGQDVLIIREISAADGCYRAATELAANISNQEEHATLGQVFPTVMWDIFNVNKELTGVFYHVLIWLCSERIITARTHENMIIFCWKQAKL